MASVIEVQPNLFPRMETSARFLDDCRIELQRQWRADGPQALVVGHNPSLAGGDRDDPTSKWWNRWFEAFGFAGYRAGNLYPFVSPDPGQCHARVIDPTPADYDKMLRGLDHLWEMARDADQVFVCWGNLPRDPEWVKKVVRHLLDAKGKLWCWGTNLDGSPKHPMARGQHRIPADQPPILWRVM